MTTKMIFTGSSRTSRNEEVEELFPFTAFLQIPRVKIALLLETIFSLTPSISASSSILLKH